MSIYNYDEFYLLSKIVWVKAEKNINSKTSYVFVPFFIYKTHNSTFTKNILNNLNYCNKDNMLLTEYLTSVCKREYNVDNICGMKTVDYKNNSISPEIFDIQIPKKLTLDPKKEYFDRADLLLSTTDIRNLSKYLSKKEQQKTNKAKKER